MTQNRRPVKGLKSRALIHNKVEPRRGKETRKKTRMDWHHHDYYMTKFSMQSDVDFLCYDMIISYMILQTNCQGVAF